MSILDDNLYEDTDIRKEAEYELIRRFLLKHLSSIQFRIVMKNDYNHRMNKIFNISLKWDSEKHEWYFEPMELTGVIHLYNLKDDEGLPGYIRIKNISKIKHYKNLVEIVFTKYNCK